MDRLSFAWWNTSLAPSAKSRANDSDRQIAFAVIKHLLFERGVDFLALGEMSSYDFEVLQNVGDFSEYEIASGISQQNRITFDSCFIWNPTRLQISTPENIDTSKGSRTFKIAQKLIARTTSDDDFYIFVSHWPSRLYCQQDHTERHMLALRLRDQADEIVNKVSNAYLMFLGDFNDEPFDRSLSDQLRATRDKALAMKKNDLFYNPFWRYMVYQNLPNMDYSGTYFDKRGQVTQWRTFDQIIVSSTFLRSIDWQLNEVLTGIVDIPNYLQIVKKRKYIFDHLPVIATFERI